MNLPVVFLAFGTESASDQPPLEYLHQEAKALPSVLDAAREAGLCEVVVLENSDIDSVLDVFQNADYAGRIAVFHYGGHADGRQQTLLFEDAGGFPQVAHGKGLAAFLAEQSGLQLVFLNACATQGQVDDLLAAGVPAIIATSTRIPDSIAADFAERFYSGLAGGNSIASAFRAAQADIYTHSGSIPLDTWRLFPDDSLENVNGWSLKEASKNFLFGLDLPADISLPDSPYRYLTWYERAHARVFFGRNRDIRNLYEMVTERGHQIILLHGQSGVGKSSLLAAGLLPYLEEDYTIVFARRDPQLGLLQTLTSRLAALVGRDSQVINRTILDKDRQDDTLRLWRVAEQQTGKPLLVILDQVEGAIERDQYPSLDPQPVELLSFLRAFKYALDSHHNSPQGKLILSFRKDCFSDITAILKRIPLEFADLFLERLAQSGIEEIVNGLRSKGELQAKYRLVTDPGLSTTIAHDLVSDPESPITPTLQILLSEMWSDTTTTDNEQPHFTLELYRMHRGNLGKFIERQLQHLRTMLPEAVESGLALDVLACHTTQNGFAEERTATEILALYPHRIHDIPELLRHLQNLYLLVEPVHQRQGQASSTRLAHDTLAQLVRKLADNSELPGQRARRILANRAIDWSDGRIAAPLDETSLKTVEDGKNGMRQWTPDEMRLVEASRRYASIQSRNARNRRQAFYGLGALILAAIGIAIWFFTLAQANAQLMVQESAAKETEAILRRVAEANATEAVIAKEVAIANENTARVSEATAVAAQEDALNAKAEVERLNRFIRAEQLARNAQLIVDTAPQQALLTAIEAARILEPMGIFQFSTVHTALRSILETVGGIPLRSKFRYMKTASFTPDNQQLVALTADGIVLVWTLDDLDKEPKEISHPIGDRILAFAVSPDSKWLAIGGISSYDVGDYYVRIWNLQSLDSPPTLLDGYSTETTMLSFSNNGELLASANSDGVLRIWRTDALGEPPTELQAHNAKITNIAFSPDDDYIATRGFDGKIHLWKLAKPDTPLVTLSYRVADPFDPSLGMTGYLLGSTLTFLDNLYDDVMPIPGYPYYDYSPYAIEFSPNGKFLFVRELIPCIWSFEEDDLRPINLAGISCSIGQFSRESDYFVSTANEATPQTDELYGE